MFKRYELHNHTDQSDAKITCRQLLDHMKADGVDCFAITDHNTTSGQPILRKLLAEESGRIQCLYGMEYTTYYGHIVCPILEQYVPWDAINRKTEAQTKSMPLVLDPQKDFVPLHPPVVIPHSWREAK